MHATVAKEKGGLLISKFFTYAVSLATELLWLLPGDGTTGEAGLTVEGREAERVQ